MYVVKLTNFTLPCRILANRTVFKNKPDRFAQGVVYDDIRVVSNVVVDTPARLSIAHLTKTGSYPFSSQKASRANLLSKATAQ